MENELNAGQYSQVPKSDRSRFNIMPILVGAAGIAVISSLSYGIFRFAKLGEDIYGRSQSLDSAVKIFHNAQKINAQNPDVAVRRDNDNILSGYIEQGNALKNSATEKSAFNMSLKMRGYKFNNLLSDYKASALKWDSLMSIETNDAVNNEFKAAGITEIPLSNTFLRHRIIRLDKREIINNAMPYGLKPLDTFGNTEKGPGMKNIFQNQNRLLDSSAYGKSLQGKKQVLHMQKKNPQHAMKKIARR